MGKRRRRRRGGDLGRPISVVGIARVDEQILSAPEELAVRCDFPVLVPSYWPDESGVQVFALSMTPAPFGPAYIIRSVGQNLHQGMLTVSGVRWLADAHYGDEDFRPVEEMPWPTLMKRAGPGIALVVKAPETRVLLFGLLPLDQTMAVARSLEPVTRAGIERPSC